MSFVYPDQRYYYDWYSQMEPRPGTRPEPPSDGQIKSYIVDRFRENPYTADCELRVDVKRGVVILSGEVPSRVAKRAAGDDCWDTPGVTDVSNQLEVVQEGVDADTVYDGADRTQTVLDVMTPDPVTVTPETPAVAAAAIMRDNDIGTVVVAEGSHLLGMLTDRDLAVRVMAEARDMFTTAVREVCSGETASASPKEPAADAVARMRRLALRRLPVVDDDRVVGIVSLGDLARRRDPGSALADISSAPPNR